MDKEALLLLEKFMPKPPKRSPAFSVERVEGGWLVTIGDTAGLGIERERRRVITTPVDLTSCLHAWLAQCELDQERSDDIIDAEYEG